MKNNIKGNSIDKSRVIFCIIAIIIIIILLMNYFNNNDGVSLFKKKIKISISPSNDIILNIGDSTKLKADINVADADIYWTSSDLSVAKVNNGNVTGVNYGYAVITATYVDNDGVEYSSSSNVTIGVGDVNSSLRGINLPEGDLYMPLDNNFQINPTLIPLNAFVYKKEFTSSDISVISVDNDGRIKSLKEGSARISVVINDKYKTTMGVYVSNNCKKSEILITPTSISFDDEIKELKVGESIKLNYYISPSNVDRDRLTWFSSETRVATVDQTGTVVAKEKGEVLIRLSTFDGKSANIIIVVE